jgi:hypothetical protein
LKFEKQKNKGLQRVSGIHFNFLFDLAYGNIIEKIFYPKGGEQKKNHEKNKTGAGIPKLTENIFRVPGNNTNGAGIRVAPMILMGNFRGPEEQESGDHAGGKSHGAALYGESRHFLQVPYSTVLRALI